MNLPPLSLYAHLPWCERKCPYCDFNSHAADDLPEQRYVDTLLRDLEADLTLATGRSIKSLFIGGGTPSLFSAKALGTLLDGIAGLLSIDDHAEITMEANPGSAEAQKFADFRLAGVNRLSLGIQSFNKHCLHALGRVHDDVQALAAVDYAVSAGFDNFNIDLMHGLPGQTLAMAGEDLRTALALRPAHISWYQLTIEPNTLFFKRPPQLPGEILLSDIQSNGEELLFTAGYEQYEVSAWCRNAQRGEHNVNYWTFGDYLGIGAGAHSKITDADGRVQRRSKRRQPDDYMSDRATGFVASSTLVRPQELPGEFAMNALRLKEGVPTELFTQRTGQDSGLFLHTAQTLCERGLLSMQGRRIRATELGFRYLDSVVAEFFAD